MRTARASGSCAQRELPLDARVREGAEDRRPVGARHALEAVEEADRVPPRVQVSLAQLGLLGPEVAALQQLPPELRTLARREPLAAQRPREEERGDEHLR